MMIRRLADPAAALVAALTMGACVQLLGDDFTVDEATGGSIPSTGTGASTGGSAGTSTTSSSGGAGATSSGGAGATSSGGTTSTGGQGGSEPPCGEPGMDCCESGQECEVLSCLNGTCPEVTPLVQVPKPTPYVGTYGIDRTEVTRKQYAQWLATNPIVSSLVGPGCGGKTSFAPDSTCMAHTFVCHSNCDDHPQVCVDWCDAYAYCTAVGKKLCKHVESGYNSFDLDPATNAWTNACTSGGVNDYSPGGTDGDCHTGGNGNTVPVGSIATCQSTVAGYTGIYDLTGNVQEWVDVCSGNMDPTDECMAPGGSFDDDPPYTMCIYPQGWQRTEHRYVVGFRCCEL